MVLTEQTADLIGRIMVKVVREQLASPTYVPAGFYGQHKMGGPADKRATGQLYDSVYYETFDRGDSWVVELGFKGRRNETAAFFVDKGSRGPFRKPPPFRVINAWLKARHITAPGLTLEQLTFATMKSIQKKGIKGIGFIKKSEDIMIQRVLPFLEDAVEQNVEEILDFIIVNFNEQG